MSLDTIDSRRLLLAAGTLAPPRAASLRGFVGAILAGLPAATPLDRVGAHWSTRRSEPVRDDSGARRRLLAQDLATLLEAEPSRAAPEGWSEPAVALRRASTSMRSALGELGLEMAEAELHLAEGLPPGYDVPFLDAVSIDASDGAHFGVPMGLHFDAQRLVPLWSETVLGHLLIHSALGEVSPAQLGRGLEEGLCEVLGALHAASAAIGWQAARSVFAARRLTPRSSPQREAFMDAVRGIALVHARHGLEGLAELVRRGRPALKRVEALLARGEVEAIDLPRAQPDPELERILDDLLLARGRPLVAAPLAFLLAAGLNRERDVETRARELGLPLETARAALRGLMDGPFVAVVSEQGELLVDDLELVLPTNRLRYDCPPSP